jgi:protein MpaA
MRPRRSHRRSPGAIVAWVLNGTAVLLLVAISAVYLARRPANAASAPASGSVTRANSTSTPVPTSYFLPTVTPNPRSTPIEDYASPTAFINADGPSPKVAGYSVLGSPITYYTFGQGERRYLIVAGIHGGYEGNTTDLANGLILHLTDKPETIPSDATLYVIPSMNPDGSARGRNVDARANANGVDLNRNFPSQNWQSEWDHEPCWNYRPTTGGERGGSEPETRAVMNFIGSHRLLAMISYHSAALGVFPGGEPWEPTSVRLASTLATATGYPFPPIDIGCRYTGTLADWAVEHDVAAAVDMELTNHADADLERNLAALQALLDFSE